jgi:hypothetical protein
MVLDVLSRLTRRRRNDDRQGPETATLSDADKAAITSVMSAMAKSGDAATPTEAEGGAGPAEARTDAAPPASAARPRPATGSTASWQGRLREAWAPWRPLRPFLMATLAPVPFLILAATLGGVWSLPALLWMTLVVYIADEIARDRGQTGPDPLAIAAADRLSVLLAIVHFLLLLLAVWTLSGGSGLGLFDGIATFLDTKKPPRWR